jgi:1,4-alpha-glucan branching enzyme
VTTAPARRPAPAAEATLSPGLKAFEVQTSRGTQRVLRVDAPGARTVEINGDFTQWRPVQLVRGIDGWWSVMVPIESGAYQMNVRIDGGAFQAPPGLLTSTDEFGGVVGILIIE